MDVKEGQMTEDRTQNTECRAQRTDKKGRAYDPRPLSSVFARPGMSPKEIVNAVRSLKGVCLTSVGMRDAGQSDFKNRHRIYDLKTLAPYYNNMGLFSAECHGGARRNRRLKDSTIQ